MLINLSNHPSTKWSEEQLLASKVYGEVIDVPFPAVDPAGDETDVCRLVDEYEGKIKSMAADKDTTVHVMGEMNFTYSFVKRMQGLGISCVASTTKRIVTELADGERITKFQFVRFRNFEK